MKSGRKPLVTIGAICLAAVILACGICFFRQRVTDEGQTPADEVSYSVSVEQYDFCEYPKVRVYLSVRSVADEVTAEGLTTDMLFSVREERWLGRIP